MFVFFQKLFRIDCGHAAGARGGDRLAVAVVLHVAGDKDAGNIREAAVLGDQVAVGIHFQFSFEDGRVRIVADSYKNAIERQLAMLFGIGVAQAYALDEPLGSENLFDDVRRDKFDFFIFSRAVDHDFRRAKLFAAVDDIDFAGVARKK